MSDEERQESNANRVEDYFTAFNKHDVTLLQRKQADLMEHVIDPLADIMRKAAPSTLAGVAALACFMRVHDLRANLWGCTSMTSTWPRPPCGPSWSALLPSPE
ncbi:hypothetical protein [Microvirga sp. P5_D2]|jgi:hypothetical protein